MSMTDQNIIINLWKAAQLLMNLEENLEEYISLLFCDFGKQGDITVRMNKNNSFYLQL